MKQTNLSALNTAVQAIRQFIINDTFSLRNLTLAMVMNSADDDFQEAEVCGRHKSLKALRLSLGLTQTQFALATGINRNNICLVENGKHRAWNPEKAAKHALKRVQTFLQHRTLGSIAPAMRSGWLRWRL